MRSLILPLVLGVASLVGLLTISPSQAEAQRFWRRWNQPYYGSYYYNPGYTYSYGYTYPNYNWGYPAYSYSYGYYPSYGAYYSPRYSSYYTPGYYGSYRWRY